VEAALNEVALAISLCIEDQSRSQALCLHILTNHSELFSLTPICATSA
jgi:hypothetical protein